MSFYSGATACHEHLLSRRFAGERKLLYQLDYERWFAQPHMYTSQAIESKNYIIVAGRQYFLLRFKNSTKTQSQKPKANMLINGEILSEPCESKSKETQHRTFILNTESSIHKSGISSALNTISFINLTPVAQISPAPHNSGPRHRVWIQPVGYLSCVQALVGAWKCCDP